MVAGTQARQASTLAKARKRPARLRKTRPAARKRLADRLWSALVKRAGACVLCGSRSRLQAAHGFSRRYYGTRWLPINGFCLCSGCHVRYTYDPLGWDAILREQWGEPVYEELRGRAQAVTRPDVEAAIAALEAERA